MSKIYESQSEEVSTLFNTVVAGGYCIGCGVCASVQDSPINITLDKYGRFCASLDRSNDSKTSNPSVLAVCPFSGVSANEDQIGQELFSENCQHHKLIGYYLANYAGFVSEKNFRKHGSSGGMGTWIITELFSQGLIDAVIHVHGQKPSATDPMLFRFQVSDSIDKICAGAKSRYYPIEMSEVLDLVRKRPGRYAIVGVPCFIKAVRLLAKQDPIIGERIRFCIGLVCGHLKSTRFADMFAWQCGVQSGNLLSINFRKKIPNQDANRYGIEIVGNQDNQEVRITRSNHNFYGYLWGHGFFKYQACDYCDDVIAETADIVVGDAWLPQYVKDSDGTNVVVVRNPLIKALIESGISSGRLNLDHISADEVAKSQDAGLRHRRDGLAYRLHLKDKVGSWRPLKRIKVQFNHINLRQKKIYELRILMASQSHTAFDKALEVGNFDYFKSSMDTVIEKYNYLYKPLFLKSLILVLKKIIKSVFLR
ncbi:MAG TPA: Coenzyme F420 hydrogenase/dehydrogenase, beta subunit C-terminal domain [Nostoc sp.]|uniref:Coenzyme F420 hydrogenase/dehydrogenase, beta subunit C-terminal domain n=1 Tax=Nostoc sp. TaxID=1180 RepID=UPI002D674273|nr:Coenzyme F420 hydrogenase/dehydrogenase, beta subunit C-terminal domain [Nostoc sp.]HYX13853.1 Coenzyme F420 hydrogenase/dehydrogenase, beta subunit C-terminal domain [Nostoc sp.]